MKQKKKIIFFDFDGVIADSFDIVFKIIKTIDPKIITQDDFRRLLDEKVINRVLKKFTKDELAMVSRKLWKEYILQMKKVKMFSGMKKVIARLAQEYTLLIISSAITNPIRNFLKRHNVDYYFDNIVGSNFINTNKTGRMKMVFKRYGVDPKDCLFVTDTLGDVKEATSVGVQSVGITWGFQKKEDLLKGKPFFIAEKPKDLLDIISSYFIQN